MRQQPIFPALSRWFDTLPREHGLMIIGLLMAQVLVVLLYLVMADNVAQALRRRVELEAQAQQRHRCGVLQARREREQCLQSMTVSESIALGQRE